MLYRLVKIIMSYALSKYFVEINVLHEERIPEGKPILLLPNHRSAFMDPVVVASQLKGQSHFITRGESFNNKLVVKIFGWLNMIPIFRREHSPDKAHQNEDIFRYCHALMEKNGQLMIFPEGICQTKFLLSPLKVGSARIALEAEQKNNFDLDVHLVPIGINYTNPHRFRGKVTLSVGEPLRAKDYQQDYEADNWKGVEKLTQDLEERLKAQILILEDQSEIEMIGQIENLLQDDTSVLAAQDWYHQRKEINEKVQRYKTENNADFKIFKNRLSSYFGAIDRLGIRRTTWMKAGIHLKRYWVLRTFLLALGLPIFILGFALHFVPFFLTVTLASTIVKRVDFMGSVLLALGILLFTVFGLSEAALLHYFVGNWIVTIAFVIIWPTLGLFTYGYLAELVQWIANLKWTRLKLGRRELLDRLQQEKINLIKELASV